MDRYEYVNGNMPAYPLYKGIDNKLSQLISVKQYHALREQQKWLRVIHELNDEFAYQQSGAVKVMETKYGRTLIVYVSHSVIQEELKHRKPLYLGMLYKLYQNTWVDDIEFKVSYQWQRRLHHQSRVAPQKQEGVNLTQIQLTPEEEDVIDKVVRGCITEKLQDSVKKLLITYKKLEKSGYKA